MTIDHILRDGLRLNVDDGDGNGAVVVFQHGLGGEAGQPAEVFPVESGLRRLTLECRGHGASQAGDPGRFSVATFADDVAALIETAGAGPVVIAGISMGAAIALRLAVRRPELVRGLVLVRPAWLFDRSPDNVAPIAEVAELLSTLPASEAKAGFLAGPTARRLADEAPDNLNSLTGFFDRPNQAVFAALLRRIAGDDPGVTEAETAAIGVPTLTVGNHRDFIHPIAYARQLAAVIPAARFVQIAAKADGYDRYLADSRAALGAFLKDFA